MRNVCRQHEADTGLDVNSTKAINPEMYPPETRKWKIMRDDRKRVTRRAIRSTLHRQYDEDAVMRTGRKSSSTKTDNSKNRKDRTV